MYICVRNSFSKIAIAFVIVLALAVTGVMSEVSVAGASQGFPLYSWGNTLTGRLGRPATAEYPNNSPARVLDENGVAQNKWVTSSTASGGSWAISTSGHLYAWGAAWNANQMGQDGVQPPAAFLDGNNINRPMRVGLADNWVQVASVQDFVVLLNSDGEMYRLGNDGLFTGANASNIPVRMQGPSNFVQVSGGFGAAYGITANGEIWAAGDNNYGILANGTTTGGSTTLVKIENTNDDWVQVSGRETHAFAINENGELFGWGANLNARTGLGVTTGTTTTPTQVSAADNWIDVRVIHHAGIALNENGQIFSWGNDASGRTAQGAFAGTTLTPTQVGAENDWVAIAGGNTGALAFNADGELWGWGLNTSGQIGNGTNTSTNVPVFVVQTYGFADAARGGGTHSMMLIRTTPAEGTLPLAKALQKPEGTPIPNPGVTFTFNVTPHSFNNNTANILPLPTIPLANRTVIINDTGTTTGPTGGTPPAGGIITTTNATDLLEGISFDQPGRFAWRVTEVQTATGVGPSSEVTVFSQAEYEIAVYVQNHPTQAGTFVVSTTTVYRLRNADNTVVNPPVKVDDLIFTNTYMRTTTGTTPDPGALRVSKTVTGQFADLSTPFSFQVTLTRTALCSATTNFTGRIMQGNSQVGANIPFTSGTTQTITLTHGQRLVFDELVVGTHFSVTELASPAFIASVDLVVNGAAISITPNTIPNTALPIGDHLVGAQNNTAAFTNNLPDPMPTGLSIAGNTVVIPVFLAAVATLVIIVRKTRKRIEELPVF